MKRKQKPRPRREKRVFPSDAYIDSLRGILGARGRALKLLAAENGAGTMTEPKRRWVRLEAGPVYFLDSSN